MAKTCFHKFKEDGSSIETMDKEVLITKCKELILNGLLDSAGEDSKPDVDAVIKGIDGNIDKFADIVNTEIEKFKAKDEVIKKLQGIVEGMKKNGEEMKGEIDKLKGTPNGKDEGSGNGSGSEDKDKNEGNDAGTNEDKVDENGQRFKDSRGNLVNKNAKMKKSKAKKKSKTKGSKKKGNK